MDDVAIIDADAHVEEDVETWEFLDEEFRDRRPIPVLLEHMDHYYAVNGHMGWWRPTRSPVEWTKSGRIHLSFETHEALPPQVVDFIGEDQLPPSTDMPHSEPRDNAVSQLAARSDLSEATKRKIRHDNPIRFYGLAG